MTPTSSSFPPPAPHAPGLGRAPGVLGRAAVALGLLLGSAASAQPDYNHDCTSNFFDSLAFMSDFAGGLPAADVNLDGRVDQVDFDGFADSRAKPQFGYYWQVSTSLQPNQYMDTQTDLTGIPVMRNCTIIYEHEFPKIPIVFVDDGHDTAREAGFQIMFRGPGGSYSAWRANYEAWLVEHFASLPAVIAAKVPSTAFDGLLCLDWETVMPLYRVQNQSAEVIAAWDDMMAAINTPVLSAELAAFGEWTIPEGATTWSGLTEAQRREFAAAVHNKVGLNFFVRTVEEVRLLRPRAKLHYYGLPQGVWPFYDATRSGYNDLLAPLWRVVDVLSPSLYQLYWTTNDPASSPCPDAVNTPSQNSIFFSTLLDELNRIKRVYPRAGQQIIPYTTWNYKGQAGQCSPIFNPTLLVNDTNLSQQLQLPWWFGADAVAIWGHYRRDGVITPQTMTADFQARWRAPMSRLTCPR